VLFDLFGAVRTSELMQKLDAGGRYQLNAGEQAQISEIFSADDCSDEEGNEFIRQAFNKKYLLDPHTATCFKTCQAPEFADRVNLIYSTAEWTKFASIMDNSINANQPESDEVALASVASSAGVDIPDVIANLFKQPIAHPLVVDKQDIESEILKFLEASNQPV